MIGIGILGCGTVGRLHAEAIAGLEGARLTAVADCRPERARSYAAAAGGVRALGSVEEMLSLDEVDLVCVCTPSGTHAALGCQAAAAGRHVVLEKPIDVTLEAADAVIAACRRAGVHLSVISQHRFDAGVTALRDALRLGSLGSVVLADARAWWYRTQAYYDADAWRGTWAADGGALLNQGVHLVDLCRWLLGPIEAVFARSATVAHRMEAEDVVVATLRWASGALGSLCVTTATPPGQPETLFVGGTDGSVLLEAGSVRSWHVSTGLDGARSPNGERPATTAAMGSRNLAVDAHRAQLQDVVDAVGAGREPAVTGADGRAALAVVLAAYESARTGREALVDQASAGVETVTQGSKDPGDTTRRSPDDTTTRRR